MEIQAIGSVPRERAQGFEHIKVFVVVVDERVTGVERGTKVHFRLDLFD